ncbi:hypothetical protein, partial [Rhizobium leguminosarum]|uniref:hypothetical protein n=1 Tax=Rhizobium leguminosarum TaxID=384 RepID=UPI001C98AEC4
ILDHCAPFNSYRFTPIKASVLHTVPYESVINRFGNPECRSVLGDVQCGLLSSLRRLRSVNCQKSIGFDWESWWRA